MEEVAAAGAVVGLHYWGDGGDGLVAEDFAAEEPLDQGAEGGEADANYAAAAFDVAPYVCCGECIYRSQSTTLKVQEPICDTYR